MIPRADDHTRRTRRERRLRQLSASVSGITFMLAGLAPPALAGQAAPPQGPPTATTETPPDVAAEDDTAVEEIVVAGRRRQVGSVVGDIAPEIQYGRTTVQSFGVSTLSELLNELAPQLRSERGRVDDQAIVLLNGLPIIAMSEVLDIPTEAIQRVDILPEDVALKYGYSPGQKVVNVVLRRRFRGTVGEAQGRQPTAGGRTTGETEIDALRVRGQRRFNFDLKVQGAEALNEADRDLTPLPAARPFDLIGNVVSPTPGAQLDPALSALIGQPVTIAAIPPAAAGKMLKLSDFAATAGVPNAGDIRRFRSLLPETREISTNVVLAGPLGADVLGTLDAGLTFTRSDLSIGLPGVSLLVPSGNPFSPFGSDVEVDRYAGNLGAQHRVIDQWVGKLAGSVSRDLGSWRLFATGGYDYTHTLTRTDRDADATALQAAVTQNSTLFDPFGSPLFPARTPADEARSQTDAVNLQVLASGPLARAPAGSIFASVRLADTENWIHAESTQRGVSTGDSLAINDFTVRGSLDVPLARRGSGPLAVGDLWLNGNAGLDESSRYGVLGAVGYGLNWTPTPGVNVLVSRFDARTPPTIQQLGDPQANFGRIDILDFETGQTVDIRRVVGGNLALKPEDRREFKIGLEVRPLRHRNLVLSANYIETRVNNPIEVFPAALTALQQAYPNRFTRNADGVLARVDYTPLNFEAEKRRELRWGLNYTQAFGGPSTAGGSPRPGAPRSASQEGGRLQLAVYDTWYLERVLITAPGGPVLDELDGAPQSAAGGQPRHEIEAQAGVSRNGVGARLTADWRSGTAIRDASGLPASNLDFSPVARLDLRFFANLDAFPDLIRRHPWLRDSRLTLALTNLLDDRPSVTDATGFTPLSYQAARLEPLGRVVRISFRKLLY